MTQPLLVDLRSDTKTRPTAAMRATIASAEVGDEQAGEDPTVERLERVTAELLGQETAIFLPSATMANQIALAVLGRPGEELVAEEGAHIVVSELGGAAVHARLQMRALAGRRGMLGAEQIRAVARRGDDIHFPRTSVVTLENTHNTAGGTVLPPDEVRAVSAACRDLGLKLHLDGARLFNASIACGAPAAALAAPFDSVSLCLSKGLGCPLGALLAGSEDFIRRALPLKHQFGGAMRQTGIVAAAGLYALEHHVDRLADDHRRARTLAEGLVAAGIAVDLERVQTNFVQIDVAAHGWPAHAAVSALREAGVGITATVLPGIVRAVTHLDVDDEGIALALAQIPATLSARSEERVSPRSRAAPR